MRFTILEEIKAETPLAHLFNTYMRGLSTLEIFSTPRESMHECRVRFAKEQRGEVPTLSIVGQAQRYYELTVLSNALGSLYSHIQDAADLLTAFYTKHGGDLTAYAVANRRHHLNEYGGGEDDDWHHTGTGNPDAGEGWEVTDTTDPARLAEYSLHRELARFFPDSESHGEYIGTSGPIDFHRFTVAVEHQTDFALRKMFAAVGGHEIPIYRQDESGEMVPIPVIEQIEQEINEDVANERLTAYFNAVLNAGQRLAELHATMQPDDATGYELLHECLNNMLAVRMEAYPPF
ncbi:hypothetical protein HMJ29_06625 [Hymenobacter taeanensis]|uniref:Uncharacterized protein n=1 Tax=Hymenobacter taeanensis TaxID=2735321 RepID=A0A6M6BF98_9BACT|nr:MULTISPECIES: hypothetical protein [Hymenobacter]QJX46629.1 hypothetical protein HMJ29_06625 [Hymenobacter taeanensis]UOQ80492.1 hypothetical protein MUN83_16965 [Hymenobacter sp. 5414T-23]